MIAGIIGVLTCDSAENNTKMIDIQGIVVRFTPNALHDTFEDGSFNAFDAVEIKVEQPEKMKGKSLIVYLDKKQKEDTRWQKKGTVVAFKIDSLLLEDGEGVFLGALEETEFK